METIAEVSLKEQPMQMAWNHLIPTELAYALADSSVSLLNLACCLKTAPFTPGRVVASVRDIPSPIHNNTIPNTRQKYKLFNTCSVSDLEILSLVHYPVYACPRAQWLH